MTIKVAATQMSVQLGNRRQYYPRLKNIIHEAAEKGANIILLTRIISNSLLLYSI